jgi:hypothetical protein
MLDNELDNYNETTFDSIKHIDEFVMNIGKQENCNLFCSMEVGNFNKVIKKAKINLQKAMVILKHFPDVRKTLITGNGTTIIVNDYCF